MGPKSESEIRYALYLWKSHDVSSTVGLGANSILNAKVRDGANSIFVAKVRVGAEADGRR